MSASDPLSHEAALSRVYGEETWSLYEELDRSLEPRGPDWLLSKAAEYLKAGDRILDAGCRDADHLIRLVQANDVWGYGIEPVAVHVERARSAVAEAGLESRVHIEQGTLEGAGYPDAYFDFVWCRDVLEQVRSLTAFLQQAARILKPGGRMLAFTVIETELLNAFDRTLLRQHLGNVEANLAGPALEVEFGAAGFQIEARDVIGTEWREYGEERTQPVSRALLRLARLRRRREAMIAAHGEAIYRHVEANLHWEVFQMLGKLLPVVYVLRRR